jgi:hypothetical protein
MPRRQPEYVRKSERRSHTSNSRVRIGQGCHSPEHRPGATLRSIWSICHALGNDCYFIAAGWNRLADIPDREGGRSWGESCHTSGQGRRVAWRLLLRQPRLADSLKQQRQFRRDRLQPFDTKFGIEATLPRLNSTFPVVLFGRLTKPTSRLFNHDFRRQPRYRGDHDEPMRGLLRLSVFHRPSALPLLCRGLLRAK